MEQKRRQEECDARRWQPPPPQGQAQLGQQVQQHRTADSDASTGGGGSGGGGGDGVPTTPRAGPAATRGLVATRSQFFRRNEVPTPPTPPPGEREAQRSSSKHAMLAAHAAHAAHPAAERTDRTLASSFASANSMFARARPLGQSSQGATQGVPQRGSSPTTSTPGLRSTTHSHDNNPRHSRSYTPPRRFSPPTASDAASGSGGGNSGDNSGVEATPLTSSASGSGSRPGPGSGSGSSSGTRHSDHLAASLEVARTAGQYTPVAVAMASDRTRRLEAKLYQVRRVE